MNKRITTSIVVSLRKKVCQNRARFFRKSENVSVIKPLRLCLLGLKILGFVNTGVPVQFRPGAPNDFFKIPKSHIFTSEHRELKQNSQNVFWFDFIKGARATPTLKNQAKRSKPQKSVPKQCHTLVRYLS